MEIRTTTDLPRPPAVFGSLKAGFDTVATHVGLILIPALLDALLWFAPRLRTEELFAPIVSSYSQFSQAGLLPAEQVTAIQQGYTSLLAHWNLLEVVRTFPIGVPSLLAWNGLQDVVAAVSGQASELAAATPLGPALIEQIGSMPALLLFGAVILLLGWTLGAAYYAWVARAALPVEENDAPRPPVLWSIAQGLLFSLLCLGVLLAIGTPTLAILGFISALSPALAQGLMFGLMLMLTWVLVPLFFAPHGIFVDGKSALRAAAFGLRLIRYNLPNSSLFVLCVFLLSQGFNMLWSVPAQGSWMVLVGIAGHAFVTTALLAASFIYYRGLNKWVEAVIAYLRTRARAQQA